MYTIYGPGCSSLTSFSTAAHVTPRTAAQAHKAAGPPSAILAGEIAPPSRSSHNSSSMWVWRDYIETARRAACTYTAIAALLILARGTNYIHRASGA